MPGALHLSHGLRQSVNILSVNRGSGLEQTSVLEKPWNKLKLNFFVVVVVAITKNSISRDI